MGDEDEVAEAGDREGRREDRRDLVGVGAPLNRVEKGCTRVGRVD